MDDTPPSGAPTGIVSAGTRSNAALLGEAAWLMLRLPERRGWPIWRMSLMTMGAIAARQFRLYYDGGGVPIAFLSWALLSPEAEARLIAGETLRPEDWASGEAGYIVDYLAVPGATRVVARALRLDAVFAGRRFSALRTRNGDKQEFEIAPDARRRPRLSKRGVPTRR